MNASQAHTQNTRKSLSSNSTDSDRKQRLTRRVARYDFSEVLTSMKMCVSFCSYMIRKNRKESTQHSCNVELSTRYLEFILPLLFLIIRFYRRKLIFKNLYCLGVCMWNEENSARHSILPKNLIESEKIEMNNKIPYAIFYFIHIIPEYMVYLALPFRHFSISIVYMRDMQMDGYTLPSFNSHHINLFMGNVLQLYDFV